jgi:hypothetical protein
MMEGNPDAGGIMLTRLKAIGDRNFLTEKYAEIKESVNEYGGSLSSPGNYNWNSYVNSGTYLYPGLNPKTDTLGIINFTSELH